MKLYNYLKMLKMVMIMMVMMKMVAFPTLRLAEYPI